MKPIIGILANLTEIEEESIQKEKAYVNNSYINAVKKSGGIPIIIPVNTDEESIRVQIDLVNGIILPGGVDINPVLYKEEPTKEMGFFHPDLDEFHLKAIKIALEKDIPVLAICRGIQVLNVALGGTLYQDIGHIKGSYIKHRQDTKLYAGSHMIKINCDSIICRVLGKEALVNSSHHQSIKRLGDCLVETAWSKDGVVEAVEMKNRKFVVGVQWHPELMIEHNEKMFKLFEKFIEESIQLK